jgi:glycosyltransferase involved in cell wall biosynthesis
MTTSFPLQAGGVSGVFVERLVRNLPAWIETIVLTPSTTQPLDRHRKLPYQLRCIRYAPRRWQKLAHQPGGIPTALDQNKWQYLLLPFFCLALFIACLRTMRHVELVHANWSVNGVIAGLAGLGARTPIVTTLRGEDVTRGIQSRGYRVILKSCLRLSHEIVAVSEAIREKLVNQYPWCEHKLSVIPNGVEPQLLEVPKRPVVKHPKLELVTIGSLIRRKDLPTILRALKKLESRQDIELSIIGSGPERANLKNLVQALGVTHKIIFVGAVSPNKIRTYLQKSDVFVLASLSEGRPNVVLEAMAAGVAVIASDIDGIHELIQNEHTGLLFPVGNADVLSRHIARLHADSSLRMSLATAARTFIRRKRLLWPETGRKYAALYQQAVEQNRV